MMNVTQADIDADASRLLEGAPDGETLDELTHVVIGTAIRASGMALDTAGTREWTQRALDLGATRDQLQEAITLVSGMGVHAFFESTRILDELTDGRSEPFDERRQALWDQYVGTSTYWDTMREEIPGFFESLLRMSPEAFEAFFAYCAVPFRSRNLTNLQKELISVAADASPSHRYLPGMRLHIRNSLKLGAGRLQIEEALRIAAASPEPQGVL